MKPILYAPNATNFDNQGLGALYDCISATVTEERNGMYELRIVYPITGLHYKDIRTSSVIKALPHENGTPQLFRVYRIDNPISGKCVIECEHISYQLNHIPCMPFTASNIRDAFQGFIDNAVEDCPFTFTTPKMTVATYKQDQPDAIRSRLGGQKGSILDVYGGEYEFDNYEVILKDQRGTNRNTTLRYGKNITDINQEENIEKTITGILPFWKQTVSEDGRESTVLVTLPEKVIHSEASENFPFQRTATVDFSQDFDEQPTVEQLRAKAEAYMRNNDIGIPEINIEVSFVALWGTEEYSSIAPLERVYLCDTVQVVFDPLGISATAKVIKTVFDVLEEKYDSIQLGEAKSNFGSTISRIEDGMKEEIEERPTESVINQRVQDALKKITGGYGGNIVFGYNANGNPEEMYIIDTDDLATATNVLRFNCNGIAFSKNGVEGPYITAWTIDSEFVADFIATGKLESKNGKSKIDLDTGEAEFENLTISSPYWSLSKNGSFNLGDGAVAYTAGFSELDVFAPSLYINRDPFLGTDVSGNAYVYQQPVDKNTMKFKVIEYPLYVHVYFSFRAAETVSGPILIAKDFPDIDNVYDDAETHSRVVRVIGKRGNKTLINFNLSQTPNGETQLKVVDNLVLDDYYHLDFVYFKLVKNVW